MPNIFQSRFLPIKGVNNSVADEYIDDQECSDAANYQPDLTTGGAIIKREGITKVSTIMSATVTSVYQGRNANYMTVGSGTFTFTGTSVDTGNAIAWPNWTSFATYDIMANGTQLRKSNNGTSFADLTGFPAGVKYVASANNYFYYAGHSQGTLGWATVGTLTYDAASALVLTQDENDDIVAIAPWKNSLLVLLEKSHELISGFAQLEQGAAYYSKDEGCTSHRSVCVTPYGVFWWSKAGMVWLKNDYSLDYPTLRKIPKTMAGFNRAYDTTVHGCYDSANKRVMMFGYNGGAQTTVNIRMDYYPESDAFWLHTGAGVAMAASGSALVSGVPNVYCGGYTSTYLYKVSGNDDDGTAITSYLETKREAYGGPDVLKFSRKVKLTTGLTSEASVTYSCYVDNDSAVDTAWANTIATGTVDTVIGTNRQHYKIKHKIGDAATSRTRILALSHDGTVTRSI